MPMVEQMKVYLILYSFLKYLINELIYHNKIYVCKLAYNSTSSLYMTGTELLTSKPCSCSDACKLRSKASTLPIEKYGIF